LNRAAMPYTLLDLVWWRFFHGSMVSPLNAPGYATLVATTSVT
jgi:hypothetical protein